MITVNIFTYSEDAQLLHYCVKSLLMAHNEIVIHIIDDDNHPISQDDITRLISMSDRVNYRRSTWDRGGNLNGKSCTLGIISEMRKSCAGRVGVSLKIDSDTLMLNARWIDRCIANSVALCYSLRPPVAPSGICYLIANDWLPKIEAAIKAIDLPPNCAEDISTLSIAHALCHRQQVVCLLPQGHGNPHGSWTSWDYRRAPEIMHQIARDIDIITMGNWKQEPTKSREDAVKMSARLMDIVSKQHAK